MRTNILLVFLFILAAGLRFFSIDNNPPSLTWDEVAWGYNAYTLGIDGKDEFGRFLPYDYLESFGDFKPPVYAYLTILPVKFFGINEFAVRFPSAFLGSLSVVITYYLITHIFFQRGKKQLHLLKQAGYTGLVSAAILAISPWHIMLSRAAFEANAATFFIMTGVWLFLFGVNKKPWLLSLSAFSFVLSMYTFNTARIVTPLLVFVLIVGFRKTLLQFKKQTVVAGVLGLALILPLVPFLLSPQARLRFQEVNIFSDISVIERTNQHIKNDDNAFWSKVIHNRRLAYGVEFARHYFENLTPGFLFIKGDGNPKFSIQTVGQMFFWEIPFLVAGALLLFKKREGAWWVIPIWLIISIIPAATARETPHALRIEAALPTFQLLTGYGLVHAYLFIRKHNIRVMKYTLFSSIMYASFCIAVLSSLLYFLHGYYFHYPVEYSGEWQYGYKQSIEYVKKVERDYDKIFVTTDLGRPYAYFLFFLQTEPEMFRKTADVKRDAFGFVNVDGFAKFTFASDIHSLNRAGGKILYVNSYKKMPKNANVQEIINLLDGSPVLAIYTL